MGTLLFVDDELLILKTIRRLLTKRSIDHVCVESAADARQALETETFSCVISDYRMPMVTGLQLLEVARNTQPRAGRVIMTGQADLGLLQRALADQLVHRVVDKPFDIEQLLSAVAFACA